MSSIAEQLARDIAAVTGGVVVSDTDLREARNELHERIERTRRGDRLRTVTVAAAAAIVLVALGVAAFVTLNGSDEVVTQPAANPPDSRLAHLTGTAPTPELLDGFWRLDDGKTMVRFDMRGAVRFDDQGRLFSDPLASGTYALDGDRVTVTITDHDQARCLRRQVAIRASFPEPGTMRFVLSDTPEACVPMPPGEGVLEQVLPTSRQMAELALSAARGWQPLSKQTLLHGVWLAEGGGHLLEMEPGGGYYIATGSGELVDRGQWSLRGADLTLTSAAASARCGLGDQLVLGGVEWIDPGTRGIRGTVRQNACGGAWTPAAWILVPHEGSSA